MNCADTLADNIGVSRSTVFRYEKGDIEKMPIDVVANVAEALNVSLPDLMGIENDSIQKKINDIVYNLSSDRQQNVYNFASKQLAEQNNKVVSLNPNKAVIDVDGFLSAGSGEFLDDSTQKFTAEVQKPIPTDYDFAFKINGESMEPVYHDQQIVFVKHLDEYRDGQIVAAICGPDAYLKKLKVEDNKTTLMSINTEYPNVSVCEQDSLKILGVVYA